MRITRFCFSFIALVGVTSIAFAQSSAPSANAHQPTPQEYAQRNEQIERAAVQIAELVDQDRTAQVWDGSSPVAKQLVSRDAFTKAIHKDRQTVGSLVTRNFTSLSFSQSDGKRIPAGLFANVVFATRFANEKEAVRELISFHLDSDQVWRVSGYTLR
jgi:hypothetical protein